MPLDTQSISRHPRSRGGFRMIGTFILLSIIGALTSCNDDNFEPSSDVIYFNGVEGERGNSVDFEGNSFTIFKTTISSILEAPDGLKFLSTDSLGHIFGSNGFPEYTFTNNEGNRIYLGYVFDRSFDSTIPDTTYIPIDTTLVPFLSSSGRTSSPVAYDGSPINSAQICDDLSVIMHAPSGAGSHALFYGFEIEDDGTSDTAIPELTTQVLCASEVGVGMFAIELAE